MKILDKYIELIEKGYCKDCNELNCIGNFPQEKIAQEIKQLQQENQHLKKQKDDVVEYIKKHFQDDEGIVCKVIEKSVAIRNEKFIKDLLRMLGEINE